MEGSVADGLKLLGIFVPQGAEIRFSEEGTESLQIGETFRMVSGKDKVGFFKSGLTEGKSQVKKLGIIVDGKKIAHVWQKPECANWIRRFVTREEEPVKAKPVSQATPPGLGLIIPPLEKSERKPIANRDNWDWFYLGAGNVFQ